MERQTKGIWIQIEIWEDKNLSWNERILLLEIDSFTTKDKDCFINNEYIANLLNVSETTANKILSSLIKKGYVIKTAFDGRRRYVKSALQLKTIQPCTLEQPCLALYDNILNTSNNTIKEDNIIILSKKAEDNAEHANVNPLLEYNDGVKKCSKKSNKVKFDVRADLSYVSEELKDSWNIWLDYKDEIKKQYKTERGAKMMYSKLEKYSDGNPILANAIVNEAICHSWDGFYSLSDKQKDFFLSDKSPYRSENSNSSYIAKRLQELDEKIEKYK